MVSMTEGDITKEQNQEHLQQSLPPPEVAETSTNGADASRTAASLDASRTFSVPPTFTSLVVTGSFTDRGTEGSAP